MKAVLLLGSSSDEPHAQKITEKLDSYGIPYDKHVASAHKQPEKLLEILRSYEKENSLVYVTVAGRSNTLSGFVAANSSFPTLACPPFKDRVDMMVNIHSTLQMPSQTPVLTILDPDNCALAVKHILSLATENTEN